MWTPLVAWGVGFRSTWQLTLYISTHFEDAQFLYHLWNSTVNLSRLEPYVEDLGVEDDFEQLRSN